MRAQRGRELYGKIKAFYNNISGNSNIHYLNKRRYDSFYGTPLDSLLRERNIKDIEIVGVCTDICILHTAFQPIIWGITLLFRKMVLLHSMRVVINGL